MERRYRLQKNKAFQYVYHRGKSVTCRDLVMLQAKGRGMKVGFSVSKKVGNAVTRNLVKRRLRECFRPYLGDAKNGLYVVVARPSAAQASFQSLQRDVRYLLRKLGAIPPKDKQPSGEKSPQAPAAKGSSAQ
ncbi:MAG: ribonuclease P protein component [Clostridia bacterium]|nr:ribonuclease P protein component [Clostridia bacterium]